jgi:dihydrofolate reductase
MDQFPYISGLNLIVAHDKNRLIGSYNILPWRISADLRYFKKVTENECVIMGNTTFKSLGFKTLPNRINVVITENQLINPVISKNSYLIYASGAQQVLSIIRKNNFLLYDYENDSIINKSVNKFFIIGGETVYKQFLTYCERLYITEIQKEYIGDRYFPSFDQNQYRLESVEYLTSKNQEQLHFKTYKRI